MNQDDFHRLISGRKRGVGAAILRLVSGGLAKGYGAAIALRNSAYSKGLLKSHKVDAAVFSVGNITVGGTGKTPLVVWLAHFLCEQRAKIAILTRGYKSNQDQRPKTQDHKDEVEILRAGCPGAKVIVKADRVAAAGEAVEKYNARVIIFNDGFQHRRLHRDIDIVTIDATCPFGYRKLLPAGLLREGVCSLRRADAVVITRCDQADEGQLSRLEKELAQINPDMIIARSIHAAVSAKSADGEKIDIGQLKGKKIFAFCGIGNPQAFFKTVKALGSEPVGTKVYDDHHHYTNKDLTDIYRQAERLGADLILTTQKDQTEMGHEVATKTDIPLAYLAIELKFTAGEAGLKQLIEDVLAGKISAR